MCHLYGLEWLNSEQGQDVLRQVVSCAQDVFVRRLWWLRTEPGYLQVELGGPALATWPGPVIRLEETISREEDTAS